MNMVALARQVWPSLYGKLISRGFNIHTESIAGFLDAAYATCVEGMDEDKRREWNRVLDTAPAGYNGIDEEQEAASFLAMVNESKR